MYPAASPSTTTAVSAIAPRAIHRSHAVISVDGVMEGSGVSCTSCADAVVASGISRRQTMNAEVNSNLSRRGRTGPNSINGLTRPCRKDKEAAIGLFGSGDECVVFRVTIGQGGGYDVWP